MNRIALAMALLAAPGIVLVTLVQASDLVPALVPPVLAVVGGLAALAGAATSRPRVHGAGTILALAAVSLTGVGHGLALLALGVGSVTLLIASLNLQLVLPREGGGVLLVLTAVVGAILVAALGVLVSRLSGWLGGGGVDATGGLTAWLVVLLAVTWGLTRWARGEAETG